MVNRKFLVTMCMLSLILACLIIPISGTATQSRLTPATLEFTDAQYNTSLVEVAPQEATVLTATFDVTGILRTGGPVTNIYDYTVDRQGTSKAYEEADCQVPVTRTPVQLEAGSEFSVQNYSDVNTSDDMHKVNGYPLQVSCQCSGTYHYFKFAIDEATADEINVTWEGWGGKYYHDGVGMVWNYTYYLFIYNYNDTQWEEVGSVEDGTANDVVITDVIDVNASYYIGTGNIVSVLAVTDTAFWIMGTESTQLLSDFVKIEVTNVIPDAYPTDPKLDVGDDGDLEWQVAGTFDSTANLDVRVELQDHIDAAGSGSGVVAMVFNFSIVGRGALLISNIDIQYQVGEPPEWSTIPDITMQEDEDGEHIIDLYDYITDDHPMSELVFTIFQNDKPVFVPASIDPDGHHLNITPIDNWWGETRISVRATDIHSYNVISNAFKVTIDPVNDPPVLEDIPDQLVYQGDTFDVTAVALDVDQDIDWDEVLTYQDDTDLFDIGLETGQMTFVPTIDHVKDHWVNITVTDGEASDRTSFKISVLNINDPPTLHSIPDMTAYEDILFSEYIEADDVDIRFGDKLYYTDDAELFDIDTSTGLIEFMPTQNDLGTYTIKISVADNEWETVEDTFILKVVNTNDVPTIADLPDVSLTRGDSWTQAVDADDVDFPVDTDEALTYSVDHASISMDPVTGEMAFTPTKADEGTRMVTVTVTDTAGANASTSFELTVTWPNQAPTGTVSTEDDKVKFKKGKVVKLIAEATDPEGDPINYTWMEGTTVLGYDKTIELENLTVGVHNITVTFSDGIDTTTAEFGFRVSKKDRGKGSVIPGFDTVAVVAALGLIGIIGVYRRRTRA